MKFISSPYPGIRKTDTGKYYATKSVNGKRTFKMFDNLRVAINWKNTFVPDSQNEETSFVISEKPKDALNETFGNVVERYIASGMSTLTKSTRHRKSLRLRNFINGLESVKMRNFGRSTISNHLEAKKLLVDPRLRRCNFDKELKDLSSVFNWYHEDLDEGRFDNPVIKKHFKAGFMKKVPNKDKVLSAEEVAIFVSHLKEPFKSMAILQFLFGVRIGEIAALNTNTVNFKTGELRISDTIVWEKGSPVHYPDHVKGEEGRAKKMTDVVTGILSSLNRARPKDCIFFFNRKGKPFRYDMLLKRYNEALQKAGLGGFSGTHIMRHSMATFTRREADLNTAQSLLAHTTSRQTEKYAKLDADKRVTEVVKLAERFFVEKKPCV